jgi:hypothetical protein
VLDIVRNSLILSTDGLPLGLIHAQTSFTDISYFFSASFWGGIRAISSRWQKWLISIYFIVAGFVVVLAGPATAVLVLPSRTTTWQAGAAKFSMVESRDTLYPVVINSSSIDGPQCFSLSTSSLHAPDRSRLGCPWAGFSTLLAAYSAWGGQTATFQAESFTVYEYGWPRQSIQRRRAPAFGAESWAMATSVCVDLWAFSIQNA